MLDVNPHPIASRSWLLPFVSCTKKYIYLKLQLKKVISYLAYPLLFTSLSFSWIKLIQWGLNQIFIEENVIQRAELCDRK